MRHDVIFVINDLFIRCGEVLARRGHVGVPHVHRDGLDARQAVLRSTSPKRAVQAGPGAGSGAGSGKAEHLPRGANPRFVVTSLGPETMAARALYEEVYCARGDMENRIKEQQLALFADRRTAPRRRRYGPTSCACTSPPSPTRCWSCCGAGACRAPSWARAQCDTIRLKLLKIGVRIRVSVRAVRLSFDEGFPEAGLFGQVLARLQSLPLRS